LGCPLKTTGTAPYAYERHDVLRNPAYGAVIGAAIAKGRIASLNLSKAKAAPGVLAIVTADNAGKLRKGKYNTAKLLGGPDIEHYHQAIAVIVAERPSSRQPLQRNWSASTTSGPRVRSTSRRRRIPLPSPDPNAAAYLILRWAISPARSLRRRSSWIKRTLRQTSRMR
jgi:hypothetical protein